ncbi:MAG TPA: septum formation initiator family protein [Clostridia bacterium]|nr:septum formation initiator family protein [Clostridia bacterium]
MSKRKKKSPFAVVSVAVLLVYLLFIALNQQKLLNAKDLELGRIENRIDEETKLNDELNKEKEMIQSDEYIEKVAREKLGMVKKDQKVYVDIGK